MSDQEEFKKEYEEIIKNRGIKVPDTGEESK